MNDKTQLNNVQVRKVAGIVSGELVLVGGRDPITASRSNFRSTVLRFNIQEMAIEESYQVEKSKPFLFGGVARDSIIAGIPMNFSHKPSGLFVFDHASFKQQAIIDHIGVVSAINSCQASGICLAASRHKGQSLITEIREGGECRTYPVEGNLLQVLPALDGMQIRLFSLADVVQYELYDLNSRHAVWQFRSFNRYSTIVGARFLATCNSEDNASCFELVDLDTGKLQMKGTAGSAFGASLHCIDEKTVAMVDENFDIIVLNCEDLVSRAIENVGFENAGWVDLYFDELTLSLFSVATGNHRNPITIINRFSINEK